MALQEPNPPNPSFNYRFTPLDPQTPDRIYILVPNPGPLKTNQRQWGKNCQGLDPHQPTSQVGWGQNLGGRLRWEMNYHSSPAYLAIAAPDPVTMVHISITG